MLVGRFEERDAEMALGLRRITLVVGGIKRTLLLRRALACDVCDLAADCSGGRGDTRHLLEEMSAIVLMHTC